MPRSLVVALTLLAPGLALAGPAPKPTKPAKPAKPAWQPKLTIEQAIVSSRACAKRRDVDLTNAVALSAVYFEYDREERDAKKITGPAQPRERHWEVTWKQEYPDYGLVVHFIHVFDDGRCTMRGGDG